MSNVDENYLIEEVSRNNIKTTMKNNEGENIISQTDIIMTLNLQNSHNLNGESSKKDIEFLVKFLYNIREFC